jgi:inward rectifier potassium channel
MATSKKINSRATATNESGFGTNSEYSGGRFYHKDGTPNLRVNGITFLERLSMYNTLLKISRGHLLTLILLFYFAINLFFTIIYLSLGPGNLGGAEDTNALSAFWEAFFFSVQTVSTVGYGHVYPIGFLTNFFAGIESLIGLLAFAFATGLIYGRFTRPRAYIRFSKNALIGPFRDGLAVMFRLVPYKHNHLIDAEVKVTLAMKLKEDGTVSNKFFTLPLELSRVNALMQNWTIVHPINEQSPFNNLSIEDLKAANAELLIVLKAFDESFSNTVVTRASYVAAEFVIGGKFKLMYHPSEDRSTTILDISKLDEFEVVSLPVVLKN